MSSSNVCVPGPKILNHTKFKHGTPFPTKNKYQKGTRSPLQVGATGGFDYPTQLVGSTPDGRCTVYYDPSLGSQGLANAQAVLGWATQIYQWHDKVFGFTGGTHNVIVANLGGTDGSGGAYHYGCDFTSGADLYLCAAFSNNPLVAGLYAAELSEAYMQDGSNPNKTPWNCGFSTGEGLSRVCANYTCVLIGATGAMEQAGFGAASSWNTADDWISQTEQTDGDYDSTGAAMVYINWMISLGYPLYKIVAAPGDTCANNYAALTGKASSGTYLALVSAVKSIPGGVTSDEPFTPLNPSTAIPPGPLPPPPPPPPPPGPPPSPPPVPGSFPNYVGTITSIPGPITLTPSTSSSSDLRAALEKEGLSPAVIADILQLAADIRNHAGLAVYAADLLKILGDLNN